jgi:hypothetical protein
VTRAFLVALLVLSSTARAQEESRPSYRAVVDRVELEPASITGQRLRVYLSALSLAGQRLDLTDPKSIRLFIGSGEKQLPYALGTYDATGGDTVIVVLVQVSQDMNDALPTITDALDRDLLAALGEHAQVAILPYGDTVGAGKLEKVKVARGKLGGVSSDGSAGDPAMLEAVEHGLALLRKAESDPAGKTLRKVIILIGDGRDVNGDRDRITAAGKRAAKEGVRIHAIAYSPEDVRRPLLALGELAKRSMGTFRWPGRGHKPTSDSWDEAFKQLREEIVKQYVITYFVGADDDIAGKKLHIVTAGRTEVTSNEVKIPDTPGCNGAACDSGYCAADGCIAMTSGHGRGFFGWLLIIVGGALGAIVVLGVIGYFMTKRQQRLAQMPPVAPSVAPPVSPQLPQMPQMAPQMPLMPQGRPPPALLVMTGPLAGQRVMLRNGFLIGKQPGCDLVIDDGFTSSQHAQIGLDPHGNCRLYDRGSTNGTFINGVPVRESVLEHGAMIRIGSTELRFLAQ